MVRSGGCCCSAGLKKAMFVLLVGVGWVFLGESFAFFVFWLCGGCLCHFLFWLIIAGVEVGETDIVGGGGGGGGWLLFHMAC